MALGNPHSLAMLGPPAPAEPWRLGLLGGTFDPIHVGHLIIAEEARARFGLSCVLFIPARVPPHKSYGAAASAEDRMQMVRLAIQGNAAFDVSDVDLGRDGPSFTVHTLSTLRAQLGPRAEFYFIMGADSLVGFKTWHNPREIIRLTRLIAISRPGYPMDLRAVEADVPGIMAVTELLTSIDIGISSTDLRARVHEGQPIRYQVPDAVDAYIRARRLYLGEGVAGAPATLPGHPHRQLCC